MVSDPYICSVLDLCICSVLDPGILSVPDLVLYQFRIRFYAGSGSGFKSILAPVFVGSLSGSFFKD